MVSALLTLESKTKAYLQKEGLIDSFRDKLLLAVSGGVDSMVLAMVMKNLGFTLGIAHCNYRLRGANSDADAELVRKWAQCWNIPFFEKTFNPKSYAQERGVSLQMAARTLRYEWFETIRKANGYQWIATAHHRNDLLETVLMNLVKGTGLKGMQGILPLQGNTIRPLLFADKSELIAYARENDLDWREDESNQSTQYQRNFLRHRIIPELKSLNPALESTIYDDIRHFRDVYQVWERTYKQAWNAIVQFKGPFWYLPLPELQKLDPLRLYLHAFLYPLGFNQSQIGQIQNVSHNQSGAMFFADHYQLEISRRNLIIGPRPLFPDNYTVKSIPGRHSFAGYTFSMVVIEYSGDFSLDQNNTVFMDWEALSLPITFRTWLKGDWFYPLGMSNAKKLSDFFVDKHFARLEKSATPLLVTETGAIAWVVGCRIDDRFKVTRKTRKILRITVEQDPWWQ